MNLFFQTRQDYVLDKPLEEVQTRIKWIVSRRWDDYSMDMVGKIVKTNFDLTTKWPVNRIKGIDLKPGHIKGSLAPTDETTCISIFIVPNKWLTACFYFLVALFAFELTGLDTLVRIPIYFKLAAITLGNLLILRHVFTLRTSVKRRFEQLMLLGKHADAEDAIKTTFLIKAENIKHHILAPRERNSR